MTAAELSLLTVVCKKMRAKLTEKGCLANQRLAYAASKGKYGQIELTLQTVAARREMACCSCERYDVKRLATPNCSTPGCENLATGRNGLCRACYKLNFNRMTRAAKQRKREADRAEIRELAAKARAARAVKR